MNGSAFLYWLACYFTGSMMTAFLIGKLNNTDLRQHGSRNLGARNAGRILGTSAFVLTFIGDAMKGLLAIVCGRMLGLDEGVLAFGMLFVITGHMYPPWTKFHGGKGVATFIGAGLTLDPLLFCWMITGTLPVWLIFRNLTRGMLGGFALYLAGFIWAGKVLVYSPVMLAICLIVWKHRSNLARSAQKGE